jgi:hypothetical protein
MSSQRILLVGIIIVVSVLLVICYVVGAVLIDPIRAENNARLARMSDRVMRVYCCTSTEFAIMYLEDYISELEECMDWTKQHNLWYDDSTISFVKLELFLAHARLAKLMADMKDEAWKVHVESAMKYCDRKLSAAALFDSIRKSDAVSCKRQCGKGNQATP